MEGATVLLGALKDAGYDVTYMRNREAVEGFPYTTEEMCEQYDLIVLSDIPADSLLLPHDVFVKGERRPNRLRSLARFAEQGGGLLMIGGFMSFGGFEGRGRYALSPLAAALPVEIARGDDRLNGGAGIDTLTGGAVGDTFIFDSPLSSLHADKITDFALASDAIALQNSVFTRLTAEGDLTVANLAVGTARTTQHFVIYEKATGHLFYDRDGSGTAYDPVRIASLLAGLSLTADHFDVI